MGNRKKIKVMIAKADVTINGLCFTKKALRQMAKDKLQSGYVLENFNDTEPIGTVKKLNYNKGKLYGELEIVKRFGDIKRIKDADFAPRILLKTSKLKNGTTMIGKCEILCISMFQKPHVKIRLINKRFRKE